MRTDSKGTVYVFASVGALSTIGPAPAPIQLFTSTDGGRTFSRGRIVQSASDTCDFIEPSIGRCVMDGIAGARSDLSAAPSVDIANGAPTGAGATDRIVMSWADGNPAAGGLPSFDEQVRFTTSTDGGRTWAAQRSIGAPGDRAYYAAPAISPDGRDVYVVYNAFTTPFRQDTTSPRGLVGAVLRAPVSGAGVGSFSAIHRGVVGDPRGSSQNNLAAEFLGDYVYASATNTFAVAVWNDTRDAGVCPAVNAYRQELHDLAEESGAPVAEPEEPRGEEDREKEKPGSEEETPEPPAVQQACPATFGNSDIYGFTTAP